VYWTQRWLKNKKAWRGTDAVPPRSQVFASTHSMMVTPPLTPSRLAPCKSYFGGPCESPLQTSLVLVYVLVWSHQAYLP
jgi:hypothetical protein